MAKHVPKGQVNKAQVDLGKLTELSKQMKDRYSIRVGIIGNKATEKHEGTNLTYADLGAVHEFGATIPVTDKMRAFLNYNGIHLRKNTTSIIIPTRSFLRMPLLSSAGKKYIISEVTESLKIDNNTEIIENLSPKTLATAIGAKAYERVMKAFETDGFGNWQPLSLGVFAKKYEAGIKDYNKLLHEMEKGKVPYSKEKLDNRLKDAINPRILVESGGLLDSITFEVKKVS